jgi:hypothetical protein
MNIDAIIQSLKDERSRIDAALRALGGEVGNPKLLGKHKRTLSPSARRKISRAQKARWAKRKAGK